MRLARKSLVATAVDRLAGAVVRKLANRNRRIGRDRFFLLPDDYIGSTILAEGAFEKGYLASLDHLVAIARDRGLLEAAAPVALDIGANIGTHTVFLSRLFPRVHSFEPNPMIHHVLEANIALNELVGVTAHRIALSDRDETLAYRRDEEGNFGGGGFERDPSRSCPNATCLQLRRADAFVLAHLAPAERVVLIKIDVEGLEDKVIAGLAGVLARDRPLIACEIADKAQGDKVRPLLVAAGYAHLYEIHNRARFPKGDPLAGLAHALTKGIDYRLAPLGAFEDRIYPMIVASVGDLID